MSKGKKEQLKEAFKTILQLVLECYPELRKMFKPTSTVDQMASDIMAFLEEFTPEKLDPIEVSKIQEKILASLRELGYRVEIRGLEK